jgi:hypothetical protein
MQPLGRNCGVGFKAWHPAPLHFRIGRDNSDRDYLADFRALGLLEVQPGNSLSSMFRMRSANRPCETEKNWKISQRRGDSEPKSASHAINYAKNFSRSRDAVIRVYDAAGNLIETHEHSSRSMYSDCQFVSDQVNCCVSGRAIDMELVSATCITK